MDIRAYLFQPIEKRGRVGDRDRPCAIIAGLKGTAAEKTAALTAVGVRVVNSPAAMRIGLVPSEPRGRRVNPLNRRLRSGVASARPGGPGRCFLSSKEPTERHCGSPRHLHHEHTTEDALENVAEPDRSGLRHDAGDRRCARRRGRLAAVPWAGLEPGEHERTAGRDVGEDGERRVVGRNSRAGVVVAHCDGREGPHHVRHHRGSVEVAAASRRRAREPCSWSCFSRHWLLTAPRRRTPARGPSNTHSCLPELRRVGSKIDFEHGMHGFDDEHKSDPRSGEIITQTLEFTAKPIAVT